MATSLLLMSSSEPTSNTRSHPPAQPDPNPNPNPPRPRGRKSGGKSQNGSKKQPQRGMGVAQLERLLRQQNPQNPLPPPPPHHDHHHHPCFHYHHDHHDGVNPLSAGFAHYGFPVLRGSSGARVLEGPTHDLELPSMPNIHHSAASLSYKKKRVIGDEVVGFMKSEKEKCGNDQIVLPSNGYNFSGFDHHHHHHHHHHALSGGFPAYYNYGSGSEVVAIHKKGNGTGNVMMEYGFFPGIPEENSCKISQDYYANNNNNNNYKKNMMSNYYEMGDLKLKMGCSDYSSCSPSPSSSSSLSSLTTATNSTATRTATTVAASNTCSLDLSLKLSY